MVQFVQKYVHISELFIYLCEYKFLIAFNL